MKRWWQQLKNIYHFFQAHAWRLWYGRPERVLTLYGVTGTNGKTTTCHLLTSILAQEHGEEKVGMLTTIAFRVGKQRIVNERKMTTLQSKLFFRYLQQMREAGVTHVVIEVTSHALDQHRLAGIALDGAIILNVAREHLDYHHTMQEYAAAKEKIVRMLKDSAPLVGKEDDPYVSSIMSRAKASGVPVAAFTAEAATKIVTPLPGIVNQENALAAQLLAEKVGTPASVVASGIAAVTSVPGRMNWLDLTTGARALIDYAVTPDALERLYGDLRQKTAGKIYAVLGACGLRDRGKRPDMARAVAQYVDELVITREDPWTESEEQIFGDLEGGLQNTATPWSRIVDRRQALAYVIKKAGPGDVVVATGKGAETGMGIGTKVIPWHEAEIIHDIAREISGNSEKKL